MTVSHDINRPRSIALIDLSYLFKRNYMVPRPGPLDAANATLAELASIRSSVGHTIVCLDAPPYKRAEVFPAYKAQREKPLPQELAQKRYLLDRLKKLGYQLARCAGYEADDIIATLAKVYSEWCDDVRIYISDKDAAQCVTEQVIQYIPAVGDRKEERRDRLKVKVKFGCYPEQMALYQALTGDDSDNIPGIPGIGPKRAAALVSEHRTLVGLAEALAGGGNKGAMWTSLAEHWNDLKVYLDLCTLDTQVPLDHEALLYRITPEAEVGSDMATSDASMDVDLDGFMGNQTPAPSKNDDDEIYEDEQPRSERKPALQLQPLPEQAEERNADRAAREAQEREQQEEQAQHPRAAKRVVEPHPSEHPDRPKHGEPGWAPEQQPNRLTAELNAKELEAARREKDEQEEQPKREAKAPPAAGRPPVTDAEFEQKPQNNNAQPQPGPGLVKAPANYGLVTEKLQPLDLRSARVCSEWIHSSGQFPAFNSPTAVFTVIVHGKELGIDMITALTCTHMVEGKPVKHADLIRALAEKDRFCEYLMPLELTSTYAVWETKHRRQPKPVTYRYTIEEAEAAGLLQPTRNGKPSNWVKRPRDMLSKTAGTKLARLIYPGSTLGLYCPEELGVDIEEQAA
jgi:5'-3' exonuclease